ncbi:plasmid pRiA4b ORF-3 family protein [Rhodococcus sp. NPDC060086]|uniref:plasmid pRiA4b ORF-3 family protein n=1 Tax=Rhodococcus sp. NPDC060086 TaxID=3347055 RepID=UPI00365D9DBB
MSNKNGGSRGRKRAEKTKKRRQRDRAAVISLTERFRRTALDEYTRITAEFHTWLLDTETVLDDQRAGELIASVAQAVDTLAEETPGFSATAWRGSDVDHLIDVVLLSDRVVASDEARLLIVSEVAAYLLFLSESGFWTGSDDDYTSCIERIGEYVDRDGTGPSILDIPVPEVEPAVELAALTEMPLVKRMEALVDWVGTSRPITSTGALKLAAVPEAAALFGHSVTTSVQRSNAPGLFDDPAGADGTRSVRSMWDVAGLSEAWTVAHDTGLLTSNSTVVTPGPTATLWHRPVNGNAFLDSCRNVVSGWIVASLSTRNESRLGAYFQMIDQAITILFAAGSGDQPVPCDADERRAVFETAPEGLLSLLDLVADTRAESMVADGFFDITDGTYRVPEPLKPAVHQALTVLLGDIDFDDIEPEPGLSYTVKVSLSGMKPPVWRRVVVDSGLPLCCLHDIIQACFDWDDSHLHMYTDGAKRGAGRAYLPDHQMDSDFADMFHDVVAEETVAVATALPKVGAKLTYEYDFGDSWTHEIVVEAIGDVDPEAPRAVCTGGRGMAPAEDSGGPWGWAQIVAAIDDPAADDHEQMREWLGLNPGERIDPKAFDTDGPNERLERLFG